MHHFFRVPLIWTFPWNSSRFEYFASPFGVHPLAVAVKVSAMALRLITDGHLSHHAAASVHTENNLCMSARSPRPTPARLLRSAVLLTVIQHTLPLIFAHKVNLKAIDYFSPSPTAKAAHDSTVSVSASSSPGLKSSLCPRQTHTHIHTHT